MKAPTPRIIVLTAVTAAALALVSAVSLAKPNQHRNGPQTTVPGIHAVVSGLPAEALSTDEEAGLLLMREEEKLARDVYAFLYEQWQASIFENIAMSEQRHMNAVKLLIDKYGLIDPVTDPAAGIFTNPDMATHYEEFTDQGALSLIDAFTVGATIEDMDINDLQQLIAETDNADLALVYANLLRGSRNHLRAFVYRLSLLGVTYEAQYITPEELEDIITSPWETGNMNGVGRPGNDISARNGGGMNRR